MHVPFEILLELLFSLLPNIYPLQEELGEPLMDKLSFKPCFASILFFAHLSFQTEQETISIGILKQSFDVNHVSKNILRINRPKNILFCVFKSSTKF